MKEGYYIGPPSYDEEFGVEDGETKDGGVESLRSRNVWPSEKVLPTWRHTMTRYFTELTATAQRLKRLMALALRAPADSFDKPGMFDDPCIALRLVRYEPTVSRPEAGVYGAGAHTDYGFLTLLATDGVPGLEIFDQ